MITASLLVLVASYQLKAGVTPVQKVVQLLEDMRTKGDEEKKAEEVAFTSFKTWCDNTVSNKQKRVKEAEELIEQLSADIASAESDASQLTDDIQDIDNRVDGFSKDIQAAQEIRASEKKDYEKAHADYSESIDATGRAVDVVKRQGSPSLLQLDAHSSVQDARHVLTAFLSTADALAVSQEPEVAAYKSQTGGVVQMLEQLKGKFEDERLALEQEEMEKKHASEMLIQQHTDAVERLEAEKSRKEGTRSQRQEDGATATGEKKDTEASRDADAQYLADTISGCRLKSDDFASRQKLRGEELVAIGQAIEIIGGAAVAGNADKHLPAMVQTSFGLLRAKATYPTLQKVSVFLAKRSEQLGSHMLSLLSVKAATDPFGKVKKMIKDMIVRLMEEANEETEHKGWCDGELGANKVARDSKTEDVNQLTAKADQLTADIAKASQEISDLTAAISELDAAMAEATEVRTAEKAKNEEAIADAKDAQEAVNQAVTVLKEFYAKAAEAEALVQAPMDDAPETFDKPYKGMGAEGGGVLGMLEVIASDFARLESDTSSAEDEASREYKTFSSDSAVDKATKSTELDMLTKLRTSKEGELQTTHKDLKGSQQELDAALAYYDKLRPTCVDAGVSYEERVKRRADEIQSLQEALKILSGDDI